MTVSLVSIGQVGTIGFVITAAASPIVLKLLKHHQVVDIPSARSSHVTPTPRGGGVACLLGLLGAIALAGGLGIGSKLLIIGSGGLLAALGLTDDVHNLRVHLRFAVQFVVAIVAATWTLELAWPPSFWAVALVALATVWIVGYVNAFNFMDGINGLASVAASIAGLTFALVGLDRGVSALALGGAALVGISLAFLPWNFPRARVFLGDVGSYLLGGTTAVLVVIGAHSHLPFEVLIGPEAVFLADTGWTLMSRIARGERWTAPHRTHVYQRLQQRGASHSRTTFALAALMSATSVLGLVSLTGVLWARLLSDAAGTALLIAYLASPALARQPLSISR